MGFDNRTPQSINFLELPPHQQMGLILFFAFGAFVGFVNLVVHYGPIGAVRALLQTLGL